MDINAVPQDDSTTYANNKKAIYARDKDGNVKAVSSSGWEAEETVTKQALYDLQEHAEEAYNEVKCGFKSPLYFHMYNIRMDLQVLADSTGFFKWSIKKDFHPEKFEKISEKRLAIYADAMGIKEEDLKSLPEKDSDD